MNERKKIRDFIRNTLIKMQKNINFSDSDNLFESRIINSLFTMRLLSYLENEFEIEINEGDLKLSNFHSIDSMMQFLQKKGKF